MSEQDRSSLEAERDETCPDCKHLVSDHEIHEELPHVCHACYGESDKSDGYGQRWCWMGEDEETRDNPLWTRIEAARRERDEARARVAELEGEAQQAAETLKAVVLTEVDLRIRVAALARGIRGLAVSSFDGPCWCGVDRVQWPDLAHAYWCRDVRAALASAPVSGEEPKHPDPTLPHAFIPDVCDPTCWNEDDMQPEAAPTPAQETPQETRPITCCTVPGRGKSRTCGQATLKVAFPADSDVQCCCPCHAGHPPDPLPPQPVLVLGHEPKKRHPLHPELCGEWVTCKGFDGGPYTDHCGQPIHAHYFPAPEPREETR